MYTWGEGIMPGIFKDIFEQEFVSTDTITITHNQDYEYIKVKVIVGAESRTDLIKDIRIDINDPQNKLTVELKSAQTGVIQLFDTDFVDCSVRPAFRDNELSTVSGSLQQEIDNLESTLNELDTTTSGFNNVYLFPADIVVGNPPSPTYSTTDPVLAYMFDDNKDENVYGGFSIPHDWKDDSNIEVLIGYMTNEVQVGTSVCRWTMSYHTYVSGDVYTTKTSTEYSLDSTLPNNAVSGYFIVSSFSSKLEYNDTNNPFEKDTAIMFMLERSGKHANDTMSGDAALMQIIFRYETEAT